MSLNTQVKIILVETTSPGNIGSALRAMKTMNFSKLCLVNPKHFPSDEVTALAANATDLIEKVSDLRNTLYCGITDPIPAELLAPEEIKGDETENFAS